VTLQSAETAVRSRLKRAKGECALWNAAQLEWPAPGVFSQHASYSWPKGTKEMLMDVFLLLGRSL
jgi:hypothetical protein